MLVEPGRSGVPHRLEFSECGGVLVGEVVVPGDDPALDVCVLVAEEPFNAPSEFANHEVGDRGSVRSFKRGPGGGEKPGVEEFEILLSPDPPMSCGWVM